MATKRPLIRWTEEEINNLKEVWPSAKNCSEIQHMFHRFRDERINAKAYSLGLKKTQEVLDYINESKRNMLQIRNKTIIGRDLTDERLREIALKYRSIQEFRANDNSAYSTARKKGILEEICANMVNEKFNYPQTVLYLCIKTLFPNHKVLQNTRKIIYPLEIDVYVPDLKLGFEYDGMGWHQSDEAKNRDTRKDEACIKNGIILLRIPEIRKYRQEEFIIEALTSAGYETSTIDVDVIKNSVWSMQMGRKDIIDEISNYQTLKDFRTNNKQLYERLRKDGRLIEFTSHFNRRSSATVDEILTTIKSVSCKKEFIEDYHRVYCKMMKTKPPECMKAYDALPGAHIKRKNG